MQPIRAAVRNAAPPSTVRLPGTPDVQPALNGLPRANPRTGSSAALRSVIRRDGDVKVEFASEYRGRRIEMRTSAYGSEGWREQTHRKFVCSEWLVLLELQDCGTGLQPVRKYTWSLDLAGRNGG